MGKITVWLNKVKFSGMRDFIENTKVLEKGKINSRSDFFTVIENITSLKKVNNDILEELNKYLKTLIGYAPSNEENINLHEKEIMDSYINFLISRETEDTKENIDKIVDFMALFKKKGFFNNQYSLSTLADGLFQISINDVDMLLKVTENYYKRNYNDANSHGFNYGANGFYFDYEKFYNKLSFEDKKKAQRKFMASELFFDPFMLTTEIYKENIDLLPKLNEKMEQFCKKQSLSYGEKALSLCHNTGVYLYKDFIHNLIFEDKLEKLKDATSSMGKDTIARLIADFLENKNYAGEHKDKYFEETIGLIQQHKNFLKNKGRLYNSNYDILTDYFNDLKISDEAIKYVYEQFDSSPMKTSSLQKGQYILSEVLAAFLKNEGYSSEEKIKDFEETLNFIKENESYLNKTGTLYNRIYDVLDSEFDDLKISDKEIKYAYHKIFSLFPQTIVKNSPTSSFLNKMFEKNKETVLFICNEEQVANKGEFDKYFQVLRNDDSTSYYSFMTPESIELLKDFIKIYEKDFAEYNIQFCKFVTQKLFHYGREYNSNPYNSKDEEEKMNAFLSLMDDVKNPITYNIMGTCVVLYALQASFLYNDDKLFETVANKLSNNDKVPFSEFFRHREFYYYPKSPILNETTRLKIATLLEPYIEKIDISKINIIDDDLLFPFLESKLLSNVLKTNESEEVIMKKKRRI